MKNEKHGSYERLSLLKIEQSNYKAENGQIKTNRKEKELEAACTRYARERGWLSIKLENTGHTGIPDRLYLKDGQAVFVEFKTPGSGRLSIYQLHWLERLEKEQFTARTVWTEEEFKELIK